MSFDCNNGVCYINKGGGFSNRTDDEFPLPKKTNVWTVYGKSSCPFCVKIRNFFDGIGIKYLYYDIKHISRGQETKAMLSTLTRGYDKVPMVFFYGMFIGGYSETLRYLGVTQ